MATNDPDALHAAGDAAQIRGDFAAAVDCYQQALAHGARVATLNNLAIALKHLSRPQEALRAFQRAHAIGPVAPSVLNNIGNLARQIGDLDEALAAYEACLAIRPDDADTLNNYAAALLDARRWDESFAAYDRAIAIDPDHVAASGRLYALHFLQEIHAARLAAEHNAWGDRYVASSAEARWIDRDPDRRLRVGFVSPNFEWHSVGRFLLPLLENLDRSSIEIVCYSDVARPDAMTARFQSAADHWRVTSGQNDAAVAAMVRADRVDILIDLALHLSGTRLKLFAARPALVQATYLAYCSTSGLAAMDYRLTDPFLDPPDRSVNNFRERAILLSHSYWCYPPPPEAPPVQPPPVLKNGFITFGCLNNFRKISPAAAAAWCEVLRRVPASRLIVHSYTGRHRQVLREQFSAEGIAADRLIFQGFSPFFDYLTSYHAVDIALDTFPCSGGTTTCDALWMGVAVVTLAGDIPTARSGVSILNNIGLAEWIGSDVADYVRIAADLASRPDRLTARRATMRERMLASPLMQVVPFCRDFETACRQMWRDSLSRDYTGEGDRTYTLAMTIRPAAAGDLNAIEEIDGTVESHEYLHLDRTGEGLLATWRIEPRPLREKLILANAIDDDLRFTLKQILSCNDDGYAMVAEHDGQVIGLLLAQERSAAGVMELIDVRIDYDVRRQGIATVMTLQMIEHAREKALRTATAISRSNNGSAARLLQKLNFEFSGLDTHRFSNHDLVKEQAAVLWHYEIQGRGERREA